jgi:sulfate adenylyltransferase subunit 2
MTAVQEANHAGRYELSHLRSLEAEAIHIIREVAAEFERPVLLFSGGKDSIVMLHLALKAFKPGRLPFPVMHVDTGHNFDEVLQTRDELVAEHGVRLIVAKVQDDIDAGRVVETIPSRNPREQVRRGVRRCTSRRGEGEGQGAGVQLPRRVRPVGPEEPAPRAVEPVQRQASQG